jgi:hypothetical protein
MTKYPRATHAFLKNTPRVVAEAKFARADFTDCTSLAACLAGWRSCRSSVSGTAPPHAKSAADWLRIQISMIVGFVTSWPANVWLVNRGSKVPMQANAFWCISTTGEPGIQPSPYGRHEARQHFDESSMAGALGHESAAVHAGRSRAVPNVNDSPRGQRAPISTLPPSVRFTHAISASPVFSSQSWIRTGCYRHRSRTQPWSTVFAGAMASPPQRLPHRRSTPARFLMLSVAECGRSRDAKPPGL